MRNLDTPLAAATGPRKAAGVFACGVLLILGSLHVALAQQPGRTSTGAAGASADEALERGFDAHQPSYPSPEEAGQALFKAAQAHDHVALHQILGAPSELLHTDEPEADRGERDQFAQKYTQMHRWVRRTDGSMVLHIGAENWPFPVPLVPYQGGWRFDPRAGLKEVLLRRIGENEFTAIDVCHALIEAHREPGQTHPATDETSSFIASVLATANPGSQPVRFHGYEYRVLPQSGPHFAAVAYPAAYRSSGVMTFVVSEDAVVYQKDLGSKTARTAQTLQGFRPDATWHRAEEETPASTSP